MTEETKDVHAGSSTAADTGEDKSKTTPGAENDKDKNFAALRQRNKELEEENAKLKQGDGKERTLTPDPDEDDDKGKDALKVVFERDVKEATRQWNKSNKVTAEEWAEIRKRVSLKGDETLSEITDKIDDAYHTIPSVRQRREKEIVDKARKEALRESTDEELDIGGGGDVNLGGDGGEPRFTGKEKKFLDAMGVDAETRKTINKDGNPAQETDGTNVVKNLHKKQHETRVRSL